MNKVYLIAEIFTSPQGEGLYTGTLMTFIRLAGCTVGKPFPGQKITSDRSTKMVGLKLLPIYTEMCTTYDGRTFACDTDYRSHMKLTVEEIIAKIPEGVKHVCISGGEPLMHDLCPLIYALDDKLIQVHIETSGTVEHKECKCPERIMNRLLWLTVSPKFGVLDLMVNKADEIKLLVDKDFVLENVPESILNHPLVYIQPINAEHDINEYNLGLCLAIQKVKPNWRLSTQAHKTWRVR